MNMKNETLKVLTYNFTTLHYNRLQFYNTLAYGFGIDFFTVFLNSICSSINEVRTSRLFHSIEHL